MVAEERHKKEIAMCGTEEEHRELFYRIFRYDELRTKGPKILVVADEPKGLMFTLSFDRKLRKTLLLRKTVDGELQHGQRAQWVIQDGRGVLRTFQRSQLDGVARGVVTFFAGLTESDLC